MTINTALDIAIRQARHLLFAFDGPIRSVSEVKRVEAKTSIGPTPPYLHETLAACLDSGRSVTIISASRPTEIHAYLEAHSLLILVTAAIASIDEASRTLDFSPAECLLVTSSPSDVEASKATGIPGIGYARTQDAAAHLVDAGVIASVYSLSELALALRGLSTDKNL